MDIGSSVATVRAQWHLLCVVACVLFVASCVGALAEPPQYKATSQTLVQSPLSPNVSDLSSGSTYADQQIASYASLATSSSVLEMAKARLPADDPAPIDPSLVEASVPAGTRILEITVFDRDADRAARVANAVAESLRQTVSDLESSGDAAPVSFIELTRAAIPTSSESPDAPRIIILGGLLAITWGFIVPVARRELSDRIVDERDLAAVDGLTVIGSIPESVNPRKHSAVAIQYPSSVAAESYRNVRTNLDYVGARGENVCLLITSLRNGDGKTSTATNLSVALAESGAKVLLVDADLSRPLSERWLSVGYPVGLIDVLEGTSSMQAAITRSRDLDVDILPSGRILPSCKEQAFGSQIGQLFAAASKDYDYLVIDGPAGVCSSDVTMLSRLATRTLLVVRSRRARGRELSRLLRRIGVGSNEGIAVVLNRVSAGTVRNSAVRFRRQLQEVFTVAPPRHHRPKRRRSTGHRGTLQVGAAEVSVDAMRPPSMVTPAAGGRAKDHSSGSSPGGQAASVKKRWPLQSWSTDHRA